MLFYSTNDKTNKVTLRQAVLQSLASDKGLYMPEALHPLPHHFLKTIHQKSFSELSFEIAQHLLGHSLESETLESIIEDAINFPAPVIPLSDRTATLELWHGPSLAFKDFGARFMSRLMSTFLREEERLTILVATSGDTGGAVAYGFLDNPNIDVVILYPSGKVSPLQEKQLTTLGSNINAIEIEGTFDDCQALVKQAFLDPQLNNSYQLSSANSINIARLIPQAFYYFEAYKQYANADEKLVFSVPSGNYGNLTAGLFAQSIGLPVHQFIAATNVNNVVPKFLRSGSYTPQPSIATISNAMDVGAPSNFARMSDLFHQDLSAFRGAISGYWYTDEETRIEIKSIKVRYDYTSEPHGALAHKALEEYLITQPSEQRGIFLGTAHPSKFKSIVEEEIGLIHVPDRLKALEHRAKQATLIPNDYAAFVDTLHKLLPRPIK